MKKVISSASNEDYKMLSSLISSAGIKKYSCFLVMGQDIVREALELGTIDARILAEVRTEAHQPLNAAHPQWILTPGLFKDVDLLGTKYNLLLVQEKQIPAFEATSKPLGLELIVPLGDPNNLGSLARSAWAFGISKMILTSEAVHPFHPKVIKSSAGAILKMNLVKASALQTLEGFPLWALDMKGQDLSQVRFPTDLRLLVGEEGPGLGPLKASPAIAKMIKIPTQGVESLNATVATSLALYEYRRQMGLVPK